MFKVSQLALVSVISLCAMSLVSAAIDKPIVAFKDPLDKAADVSSWAVHSQMRAVTRADNKLVAVGIRGHILVSELGSQEWTQASVPVSVDLNAVTFIDGLRGWAVGHDAVVLYTDNGGQYWYKRFDGRLLDNLLVGHYKKRVDHGEVELEKYLKVTETMAQQGVDKIFLDAYFDHDKSGFVIGPFGVILQTSDGGLTWTPWLDRIDNPSQLHLHAIRKVGDDIYIAGEAGHVWRLDPEAKRFILLADTGTKGSLFGVVGDANTLIVYGLRGRAFRSVDKGASWEAVDTGVTAGISSATLMDNGQIAAVTQAGHVLISKNKGKSFQIASPSKQVQYAGICPIENNRVSIVGLNGVSTDTIQ